MSPSSPPPPSPCWASRCTWRSPWSLQQFSESSSIFSSNICMSFNLRYCFWVSDNKQRNYTQCQGPLANSWWWNYSLSYFLRFQTNELQVAVVLRPVRHSPLQRPEVLVIHLHILLAELRDGLLLRQAAADELQRDEHLQLSFSLWSSFLTSTLLLPVIMQYQFYDLDDKCSWVLPRLIHFLNIDIKIDTQYPKKTHK